MVRSADFESVYETHAVNERDDNSIPLFLALCGWLVGSLGLLFISSIAWTLKDGLGPNAVESHGWLAFTRFLSEASLRLLFPAALIVAGCLLYRWDVVRSADRHTNSRS
jgi:hypothetical protein